MSLRVVKVDEYQFLTCFKYGLWAANKNILKKWNIGDQLVFYIDRKIAALSTISGNSFQSDEILWDVGLFPYRIPIEFNHVTFPDKRLDFNTDSSIKGIFMESWGLNYGWGINCQYPLKDESAIDFINLISTMPNDVEEYKKSYSNILNEVKQDRQINDSGKYKLPVIDL